MARILKIAVKKIYFDQIKSGTKTEENRLRSKPMWQRWLEHERYDEVVITLGYPKRDDLTRQLRFKWEGVVKKTITHPHFGPEPVEVYAIQLTSPIQWPA